MLKPRQDTPDNMLRAREDKLEKFIDKEDKAEALLKLRRIIPKMVISKAISNDIGEGFGAQAGDSEVRTAEVKTLTPSKPTRGRAVPI